MADWTTISALATAGGTMVLALATFSSVRSANRSARIAERAFQVGMRPVLVPSRLEDPPIKVLFAGQRWMRVEGGRGAVEIDDDEHVIYMLLGLRNVGAGIAVLRGWYIDHSEQFSLTATPPPLEAFRRQQRDLYIPVGDPGYWQGALRDPTDPDFDQVIAELHDRNAVTIHVLYGDHEGGQRVISRFAIVPIGDSGWLCQVTRHWNIDNDDPR